MSNLTDAIGDVMGAVFGIKSERFQKQRVTITEPAVGLLGFATMIRSPVIGEYGLFAPTHDGLRAAFKQLRLVEPFNEHAVTAVTVVRTKNTKPVQPADLSAVQSKVTDWIDGLIEPTIPGVYQRRYGAGPDALFWALWDGRKWMAGHRSFRGKELAHEDVARGIAHAAAETIPSLSNDLPWRGLAEAPR